MALTVTGITPTSGPTSRSTAVTITGTGFVSIPSVVIGGVAATNVAFVNSTTLTCAAPAHAMAVADITVTNPDASVAYLLAAFTYSPGQWQAHKAELRPREEDQ